MNAVPASMTLILCSYSHCIYYVNSRAMYHLSGASLPCWRSIQRVILYIIDSCFGCGFIYIYIHHAMHHCMVVISCHLSSVIYMDDL